MAKSNEFTVTAKKLQSFLDELSDSKKAISEKVGALRDRLQKIQDTEGYHPQALAMIRAIDAMSETKMKDFMRTFKPMFDAMYLEYWEPYLKQDLLAGVGENGTKLDPAKGKKKS